MDRPMNPSPVGPIARRLAALDWTAMGDSLDRLGYATTGPLLSADEFNGLHQDLYGPLAFPLQLTILLSRPSVDFTGGEFLLVEQRPRAQSRGEVVPLAHGEAVIFAVNHRPQQGTRGPYRVALR